ncbi:MAG TPA: isoaspartyl peptidase/L-asparaginase [Longimicrobiaceae bacterium]|nr:isoaspartyl peptidase/L-asparaginase [Longimicrobiaceae bacterium]
MTPRTPLSALAATLLAAAALAACAPAGAAPREPADPPAQERWGLVIHGGAGTIRREQVPPERQAEYHAALREALLAGWRVLEAGGTSLDAVEAAVNLMEDNPLFNAGKGAVITADGRIELDAAVMDGATLRAGAVAGLRHVKNPIDLARAVMERSPHVMMIGDGAEAFAREQGIELVPAEYFFTDARRRAWVRAREQERARRDSVRGGAAALDDERKFGTVGAVALDRHGNLAAGTSTGGMMMKRYGRVGDVPIIGAGTYANNRSCAVSATGHGEFFIRNTVAHSVCALVEYGRLPLQAAADSIVMRQLVAQGGDGGIIAMDRQGNWTLTFNSAGMYRGRIGADGRPETAIFRD